MTRLRSSHKRPRAWIVAAGLWLTLSTSLSASAPGQTLERYFDVKHDFELTPGGSILPDVKGLYYLHTYARESNPNCRTFSVDPPVQPPTFADYGGNTLLAPGIFNGNGTSAWANVNEISIPANGFANSYQITSQGSCASHGEANAEISVDPYAAGLPVTGTIRSYGYARSGLGSSTFGEAYGFGMSSIEVRGGRALKDGTISWLPTIQDAVADSARAGRDVQTDPILFTVEDLVTQEVVEGTLLWIRLEMEVLDWWGSFVWLGDVVEVAPGTEVVFEIDITSPLISPNGYLRLETGGGMVTFADDSGIYDGVLPSVGTPLPLNFALTSNIDFAYDLGDFNGHDLDVKLTLGGSGEGVSEIGDGLSTVPARTASNLENYPNPFNPSTSLAFSLAKTGPVQLWVFDERGRLVRTLIDEQVPAGDHEVEWDGMDERGRPVASGVYLYLLKTREEELRRKMALIR